MKIETLPVDQKLAWKNDGDLEMFWIGVGRAVAKKHVQSNFLIIKGAAYGWVDFGAVGPLARL